MLADLKLRPRQLFSYEKYLESLNKLTSTGIYSMVDFKFTPRDTTETCDTLDLALSCVFEKPYDFYIETRAKNSTIGRFGPELVIGLTKRNAFRGGVLRRKQDKKRQQRTYKAQTQILLLCTDDNSKTVE